MLLIYHFDGRFVKCYHRSSLYHKQWSINNIKVKCSQIGKNMSDSFWRCSLKSVWQIESVADFIILVMWLWLLITKVNFTNEWELIDLSRLKCVQIRGYFWSVFSCIRTEYGPEITPYLVTFHTVYTRLNSLAILWFICACYLANFEAK